MEEEDFKEGRARRRAERGGEEPRPSSSAAAPPAECPLCGRACGALERPGGHLRRCAARAGLPLPAPPRAPRSGLKRRSPPRPERPAKKRRSGAAEEELLVAMAMSRSLYEEEAAQARHSRDRAGRGRKEPRGVKKSRLMPPHSPPTLLLQDPEKARKQTEVRMALLLSEVDEFPSIPPGPPSQFLVSELSRKVDWSVALPKGPPSSLWERSCLVGPFCVAGSTPCALPRQTGQRLMQSTALPLVDSVRREAEERLLQERGCGRDLRGKMPREDAEGCSQKEEGALQDLMELAGEGLTLTQWNPAAQQVEEPGQERMPGNVLRSNPGQPGEKLLPPGSRSPPFLLGLLTAAFKGMVNNPHLSDVQFQVDSGELFYAHLFVLYARCPQLMEEVDRKGFWVAEEGEAKTRRVLLRDVSGEAAGMFLNYLYTAEHFGSQHVLSEVAALAARFGVAELAALCGSHGWSGQPAVGASGQDEEGRVETFEELLKSVWVDEEEEDKALLPEELGSENVVDERGLEEIYEFAATQRKAEERPSRERNRVAEVGACPMEEGAVPGGSSGGLESPRLEVRDARREAVPHFPPKEQRPLGAASRSHLEAVPELAEASRELSEKSLLAVSWGESLELFQQSDSGREPSDDAAGEDVAVVKSPTPLGLVPLSRNFSSGGSQVALGVLADELLPAASKWTGGFCGDLSLTLFSSAPQEAGEKPCQIEEQGAAELQRGASAGTAASRDAPLLPSPSVGLRAGPVLMLAPEEEGRRQVEMLGFSSKEREASGARSSPLSPYWQGRGAPLLGTILGGGADARGERIRVPGTPLTDPRDGQVATLGLSAGPEAQQPQGARDSHPTPKCAVIPSPKRQSPQGPHSSSSPWSSACHPRGGKSVVDVVVVLDDSEEEAEATPRPSWGSSGFEAEQPVSEDDGGHLFHVASPEGSVPEAGRCQLGSPARPLLTRKGTPPGGSDPLPRFGGADEGSCGSDGSHGWRRDLWSQGDEAEILPLTQRLPAPKTPGILECFVLQTRRLRQMSLLQREGVSTSSWAWLCPKVLVCQERETPCTTPPTPVPSYSVMETPVLKKELSRFGVRALPKQQMVLKLKEIFQYTHRRSDSRDTAAPLHRRTQAALRRPTAAAALGDFPKQPPGCPEFPQVLLAGGCSGASDQGHMAKRGCLSTGSGRRKRGAEGPLRGGQALVASQGADGLSGATSDTAVVLQSSSTEFETSVLTEEEDDIPASQATCREADLLVALRQHIRARPALCRQILFYQPFELARLQSELKQDGIRIALGRLLEFLDAHCITFTTAEARREKRRRRRY